jgi:CheY-like chemotaxis protein/Ran GTPase-activating protein (RanGAP) involved in mRNA processing and transport
LCNEAIADIFQYHLFRFLKLISHPHKFIFSFSLTLSGTILEATKTITGFSPEALLMTSTFETIYENDIPGFHCIKTQFWDQQQPDVEAYLRRRTIEGDWLWLVSRTVRYVQHQIAGIVVEEELVTDVETAHHVNHITRITALLVQAAEAARWSASQAAAMANATAGSDSTGSDAEAPTRRNGFDVDKANEPRIDGGNTESNTYDDCTGNVAEGTKRINGFDADKMKEPRSGTMESNTSGDAGKASLEQEIMSAISAAPGHQRTFDPIFVMKSVRRGVMLDLGLNHLSLSEVKLVMLVLCGRIPVENVCHVLLSGFRSGENLHGMLEGYDAGSEVIKPLATNSADTTPPTSPAPLSSSPSPPPPISVVTLSYTYIGNHGIEMLSSVLFEEGSALRTLDISFCAIDEKGILALARALVKRKRRGISCLQGLILSGNYVSARAASELGAALAPPDIARGYKRKQKRVARGRDRNAGYDTDDSGDSDDEDDDDFAYSKSSKRKLKGQSPHGTVNNVKSGEGDSVLNLLHVANASLGPKATWALLQGLGPTCPLRELNLSSNDLGAAGASVIVKFLKGRSRAKASVVMPYLDRLDMSNNNLGDDGATQLTSAISKRTQVHLVDLKISSNSIGSGGVETIMNKLLQHNLVSLSLDKNGIGDHGCQLVAASLQSMKSLTRLNLSFNHIGSRGVNSLMRSLVICNSITYLGLAGNVLKISGSISLAFTLAQHPRLEELDLDNCCLGQAAQCHICAGIISNRWVPMKRLRGFAVGPPMVAIGALKPFAQRLGNDECFRIRKDEQMKTILHWMRLNQLARKRDGNAMRSATSTDPQNPRFLTPDFVSRMNEARGTDAYYHLLGWLSRIPFDEEELTTLNKYFYDADGGEGDRGSDGYVNLKLRGDLLAALDSEVADEIREETPELEGRLKGSVGLDLDQLDQRLVWNAWDAFKGEVFEKPSCYQLNYEPNSSDIENALDSSGESIGKSSDGEMGTLVHRKNSAMQTGKKSNPLIEPDNDSTEHFNERKAALNQSASTSSVTPELERRGIRIKPRITMFPLFEQQLEELKATAAEMLEMEDDPAQHDVILTQYAEASLTILRQLRYHCMNTGLDGWRRGGLQPKVLVIDDSHVTRKLVARAFEKANFIVDTACDGAQGVEKLKASIYDIAFMDIEMPVMNGFEATKRLREWEDKMRPGCRQPICALTAAYVDDFERSELMKFKDAGLDVMESKPCNIPRLFKVVDDVSPMFSDLSISITQREQSSYNSDRSFSDRST